MTLIKLEQIHYSALRRIDLLLEQAFRLSLHDKVQELLIKRAIIVQGLDYCDVGAHYDNGTSEANTIKPE